MAEETRDRILEAACELIAEDGIDEVRIARVAMRAGASTALVHHYFSTREELLEQALIHSFEAAGDDRFGDGARRGPRPRDSPGRSRLPAAARPPGARVGAVGRALAARGPGAAAARRGRRALRGYREWLGAAIRPGSSAASSAATSTSASSPTWRWRCLTGRGAGADRRPGDGRRAGAPAGREPARRGAQGRPGGAGRAGHRLIGAGRPGSLRTSGAALTRWGGS